MPAIWETGTAVGSVRFTRAAVIVAESEASEAFDGSFMVTERVWPRQARAIWRTLNRLIVKAPALRWNVIGP